MFGPVTIGDGVDRPSGSGEAARYMIRVARTTGGPRHQHRLSLLGHIGVLLLLLAAYGCSHAVPTPFAVGENAPSWPDPPAKPIVRYVGAVNDSTFGGATQSWWERLVGLADPQMLVSPVAVLLDPHNRLYVACTDSRSIHIFDLTVGSHSEIDDPRLGLPVALAWGEGQLFIADAAERVVWRWTAGAGLSVFAHDVAERPAGLAFSTDLKRLFVADALTGRVVVLDVNGVMLGPLGDGGPESQRPMTATHLAYHPAAGLLVTDSLGGTVWRLDPVTGSVRGRIGSPGDGPGNLALPKGVAVNDAGHVFVVDARFENVQIFDGDGRVLMAFGQEGGGPGEFWLPAGIWVDSRGRIWVADTYNNRVQVFQFIGPPTPQLGAPRPQL